MIAARVEANRAFFKIARYSANKNLIAPLVCFINIYLLKGKIHLNENLSLIRMRVFIQKLSPRQIGFDAIVIIRQKK